MDCTSLTERILTHRLHVKPNPVLLLEQAFFALIYQFAIEHGLCHESHRAFGVVLLAVFAVQNFQSKPDAVFGAGQVSGFVEVFLVGWPGSLFEIINLVFDKG